VKWNEDAVCSWFGDLLKKVFRRCGLCLTQFEKFRSKDTDAKANSLIMVLQGKVMKKI
jgi:hypothetical protein